MIEAAVRGFGSSLRHPSVPAGKFLDAYLRLNGGSLPQNDMERVRDFFRMIERVLKTEEVYCPPSEISEQSAYRPAQSRTQMRANA